MSPEEHNLDSLRSVFVCMAVDVLWVQRSPQLSEEEWTLPTPCVEVILSPCSGCLTLDWRSTFDLQRWADQSDTATKRDVPGRSMIH
jgi:hypothetical protein